MSLIRDVRYPLSILFVVVTFVGLGVGVWSANHKLRQAHLDNARLRYELSELRRETGYLEVTDPQTLHVISLPCLEELTWRWRIHVPDNHLELYWGFNGIAGEGIEAQYTKLGCQLQQGEQVLTCAIRRDTLDIDTEQGWQLVCQSSLGQMTTRVDLPRGCQPWFTNSQSVGFAVSGVGLEPVASDPAEPLVLLRQRRVDFGEKVHQVKREPSAKKREGLLLWIAPGR
jgi:hypothetical protein